MTGTLNFSMNRMAVLLQAGFLAMGWGADISLDFGGKLTGEVRAMDDDGTITLASDLSAEDLLLSGGKVLKVEFAEDFAEEDEVGEAPGARLELTNGDVLPVESISMGMDGALILESPAMGRVEIARGRISSLQLGIHPQKVIYSGTSSLEGWTAGDRGGNGWEVEDDTFKAESAATIMRDVDLPEKFIVRFSMEWAAQPNFQLRFADPLQKDETGVNRYHIGLGGGGLGIFREMEGSREVKPIMVSNRASTGFPGNRLDVEVRMDRSRGVIHMYEDGVLAGRYSDPMGNIPVGSGISLVSKSPRQSGIRIDRLEVLAWEDRADRHRSEERGDPGKDSMIGRFGERFSGRLEEIREEGGEKVFVFQTDLMEQPLLLPEGEVSTVYFADKGSEGKIPELGGFVLRMRGGGSIGVKSCTFGEEMVEAMHPLLGKIGLRREWISSIEKRVIPKASPVSEP